MKALRISLIAAVSAGFALASAARNDEESLARADHEVMAPIAWHHEMRPLMRELSQEIERVRARMDEPAPVQVHRQVAERMELLSGTVAKMSGLLARPAHAAQDKAQLADLQRRLDACRTQTSAG